MERSMTFYSATIFYPVMAVWNIKKNVTLLWIDFTFKFILENHGTLNVILLGYTFLSGYGSLDYFV